MKYFFVFFDFQVMMILVPFRKKKKMKLTKMKMELYLRQPFFFFAHSNQITEADLNQKYKLFTLLCSMKRYYYERK